MSRNLLRLFSILLFTFFYFSVSADAFLDGGAAPSLHVDFDDCASFGDGSNADYSEFSADAVQNNLCSGLTLMGGHVYRDSSHYNMHSCAPGFENVAMCISAADICEYDPDNDKALKFDIRVIPGPDGLGSIDEIAFYERAPEEFTFIEGPTGPNDYPVYFSLRALVEGDEIFRMEDIPTNRDWTLQQFDLSNNPAFLVSDTTIFNFEILPYCLVGNGALVQAWDIDELRITGGCHNVRGGTISTNSSGTICANGIEDATVQFQLLGELGDSLTWIIVDSNEIISAVNDMPEVDFRTLSSGEYIVYHLAYTDVIQGLAVGESIEDLEGCYDLSNGLSFQNRFVEGGSLQLNGSVMAFICTSDGVDEELVVELSQNSGAELLYIVTDSVNVILKTQESDTFNFEGSPAGQCLIYAMMYDGLVDNIGPGNNITDIEGCFDLSSPVGIFRSTATAGTIIIEQEDNYQVCSEDADAILELDLTGADGESMVWILSDANGQILELLNDNLIDFTNYVQGNYEVHHLSYSGSVSGLAVGENISDISGCTGLSNAVRVVKSVVEGGSLSLENGAAELEICAGDNSISINLALENAQGDSTVYVISDTDGQILDYHDESPFDLGNIPSGQCFIQGLSYTSLNGLATGNNVDDIEGCFAFSNAITVNKVEVDAGNLALSNNSACVGDGIPDLVGGNIFDAEGPVSQLVITDSDSIILDVVNQFPVDVESAGGGTCFIFHLVSLDTLAITPGMHVDEITGCFDLSAPGVVLRTDVYAGMVSLDDGSTSIGICLSDTLPDVLSFINTSTAGLNIQYVVTDTDNVILALPDSSVVDFSTSPPGTCWVWAVSHMGNFTAVEGDTLGLSPPADGCVDITDNFVEVVRDSVGGACEPECLVDGGFVDLFNNEYCIGDGIPDFVTGSVENTFGLYQQVILTDTTGVIITFSDSIYFEVDGADPGTCWVWNLAAMDTIQLTVGMNVNDIQDECFDLSPPAAFNRLNAEGGMISFPGNDTLTQTICVGDSLPDVLVFVHDTTTIPLYNYIITDEENVVLVLPSGNSHNFDTLGVGTCLVYGLSYSGAITLAPGDTLFTGPPVTGCFDYSDNFLTIVKEDCSTNSCPVDGGSLDLFTNFVCVGDGEMDLVDGDVQNAIGDYSTFIITDTDSIIIGNPPSLPVDFETAGGGTCLVWHMSAMDSIPLNMGDHISTISACHDLSEPQSIVRVENNGGTITLENGDTSIEVCVGDSLADELVFSTTGFGVNYEYIITDTFDVIIDIVNIPLIDFENAGPGVCRVYGLAHNDVFDQQAGDTLMVPSVPGSCFDLSDNFVEIIRVDSGGPCSTVAAPPLTIVLNRVSSVSVIFDIKNISNDTVDVSDYWICRGTSLPYIQLSNVVIECGSFNLNMAPGDILGLNIGVNNMDGELAIYTDDSFADPASMLHYVEWGSSGHSRSSVAVSAGLWSTGDFVPAFDAANSIYFDGDGYSSADWTEGESNLCGEITPKVVFNRVGDTGQIVDLINIGMDTVDINDYYIGQDNDLHRVGDLVVECGIGTRILGPGDKVGLVVQPISNTDGELALYRSAANAGFGAMSDYVQWGSAGHSREQSAVFNNIWTAGDFVPAITAAQSIYYDGDGNMSSDWQEGNTSICGDLKFNHGEEVSFKIVPNPSNGTISLDFESIPGLDTDIRIFDAFGRKYYQKYIDNITTSNDLQLPEFAPGTYFVRVKSQSKVLTKKFLVVRN